MRRISKRRAIVIGSIGGLVTRKVINSTIKYRRRKAEQQGESMSRMAVEDLGDCSIEYCDESTDDRYEYFNVDELSEEDLESGEYEKVMCCDIEVEEEVPTDEE